MKIFITGMPASGKSLWAKRLAGALSHSFFDLDTLIEHVSGKKIADIFKQNGETHFRELEKAVLENFVANNTKFVLSTGGGTPCFYNNMKLMNKAGVTIWLDENIGFIANRIFTQQSTRPMFDGLNKDEVADKVQKLFEERKQFYQQAKHYVTTDEINLQHLLNLVNNA